MKRLAIKMRSMNRLMVTFRQNQQLFKIPKIFNKWANFTLDNPNSFYNLSMKVEKLAELKKLKKCFEILKKRQTSKNLEKAVFSLIYKRHRMIKIKFLEQLKRNSVTKKEKRKFSKLMICFQSWRE